MMCAPQASSTVIDSPDSLSEENQPEAISPAYPEVFDYSTSTPSSSICAEKKPKRKSKRSNFGSLSKLFSKGKQRKSTRQTFEGTNAIY